MRTCTSFAALACAASALLLPVDGSAQATATVRGVVLDAQRAVVPGAGVVLAQPRNGLERTAVSGPEGAFQITNLPPDTYELRVALDGFGPHVRRLDVRTSVPVDLEIVLELAAQTSSVTVSPGSALVDTSSAGTRTQLSMARIEQLPAPVGGRALESVLVSFPGFAQNANGAIHPRGAHNQMTFVVDGLPISDQLTGAFANALDVGIVQTVELMTGNVPAEFGSKVSGVAVITSRTGLGVRRRLAGDVTLSLAGFRTAHAAAQAGGGDDRVGYFGSVTGMRTDRFLDQVSLDNPHNAGAFGRFFGRADVVLSGRHVLRFHGMGGRSAFEIANLRSQHAANQDQRQTLTDAAGWGSYVFTLDRASVLEATGGFRATSASLHPSPGDTPVTASQRRRLSTTTASVRYSRVVGAHAFRAGADLQHFPLREHFTMGITSPAFNDPASDSFNPSLLRHDLTRGGVPFVFEAADAGRFASAFTQATFHRGPATLTLGARYDDYALLVRGRALQPRVGLAYRLPGSAGVLRASYNRTYQTPPNENLLLSGSEAASRLAPESVRQALGGTHQPIRPERQHMSEAGFQRAFGTAVHVDASVYHKSSRDQQDNNNFFDTGIIFPTTLAAIRVTGAELRVTVPPRHGVSGTFSATTGRAISTPPFTGGLFLGQDAVDLLSAGPFAIDHDQRLGLHGTVQYDPPGGVWIGASVRHDSGLVRNPSDPLEVAADRDYADLLPYVDLNRDVPRVRPRTIVDLVAGYDLRSGGVRRWSIQVQAVNLTDRRALYNFQSVFVGTRLVQPRTWSIRVKRYF